MVVPSAFSEEEEEDKEEKEEKEKERKDEKDEEEKEAGRRRGSRLLGSAVSIESDRVCRGCWTPPLLGRPLVGPRALDAVQDHAEGVFFIVFGACEPPSSITQREKMNA